MTEPPEPPAAPVTPAVADVVLRGPAPRRRARMYRPAAAPGADPPGLVVLLTGPEDTGLAGLLVRALGAVVLAVPAARVTEGYAALAWAADHAAELGADPARTAVVGDGPGAALVGRVATTAAEEGWPPLRAVVAVRPGCAGSAGSAGVTRPAEAAVAQVVDALAGRWHR